MSQLIISVSGLRGVIGNGLTPNVAIDYTAAFATAAGPGPIVVTRDGRATGSMIMDAVCAALSAMGRDVIHGGIAATPTTGILVRESQAAGGVQISASHNPPEYNGLKLFGPDGRVLSAEKGEKILATFQAGDFAWVTHDQLGEIRDYPDPEAAHLAAVLAIVDPDRIAAHAYPVLLDSNHGAGSILGLMLLEQLGCDTTILGEVPNGQFAHPPEPTAENLAEVRKHVVDSQSAVGFCQDPDADRLALIDETGRYVGEEFTVAVCLNHVLRQRQGPVVTNCSTSRMSEDLATRCEVPFHRSKVGEANVTDMMIAQGAVFGGEGNGGPIDPRVGYVRDSFVGIALVLDAMAATGKPLSQLVDELPQYAIHKSKVEIDQTKLAELLAAVESHFADAAPSHMDGLRLDWPGRWMLIRASNTEPIVRIIAEAESESAASSLCDEAAAIIGS
ncbi:MAG: phosphoglucosamine mutase [Planctomycetales bacterium]|nr:phosphoglucosamine mutase [Planctomycetales bacterium]